MSRIVDSTGNVCDQCGAALENSPTKCWLCGARCDTPSSTTNLGDPSPQLSGYSFSLEGLMLVVTLVSVCLGAFTLFPGLGILFAILMAPVLVRTTMVVRRRSKAGRSVSFAAKLGLFFGSFATAIVIVVLVSVASIGTFCAVCLGIGQEEAIPFAAVMAILTTIGAIWLSFYWIRSRWRRDTNKQ
jgi:hypothetical protein